MEIYNTTWWGNAIDTAITAGTEPDFFGSQMKMLTGQPELVTNGDFATDSDWVKQSDWTISNGANCDGNSSANYIYQSLGITLINKTYKITYKISNFVSGSVAVGFGGGLTNPIGTYRSANGTYTEYLTPTSTSQYFGLRSSFFIGSIDNVSVKLARAEEVEAVKCLADWIHTTALQDLNN